MRIFIHNRLNDGSITDSKNSDINTMEEKDAIIANILPFRDNEK